MFKAELSNPKLFKTIFSTIANIIDEVKLVADSDSIRLKTLDREHITFVGLELKPELFDEYVCDEPITLSFDLSRFMDAMNLVSSDDRLILSCNDYNLILIFEGDYESKFEIGFIEIEDDTPNAPVLDFPVNLEIESKLLSELFKNVHKISGKEVGVKIEVDEDYFKVQGVNEFIKNDFKYLHGEKVVNNVNSSFAIEKITNIMKASSLTDITELKIGDTMPIFIKFTSVAEDYSLEFLLAPRVEKDEE